MAGSDSAIRPPIPFIKTRSAELRNAEIFPKWIQYLHHARYTKRSGRNYSRVVKINSSTYSYLSLTYVRRLPLKLLSPVSACSEWGISMDDNRVS